MSRSGVLVAVGILALAAAALAFRLPQLEKRPMHCDEGNQAVKAGILLETGVYHYDPLEHHGPSLYWLTLLSLRAGGVERLADSTEWSYRIVPVVFGAGLIVLVLLVIDGLGRGAVLMAGVLTAISPAMVFYSRYYIQEMLLVFFTFAAIGCAWRYVRSRRAGWAIAAGAMLGLMHATKETFVLAVAAMAAAVVLTRLWARLRDGVPLIRSLNGGSRPWSLRACCEAMAFWRPWPIAAALAAGMVVSVALFSSFGTYWSGPVDSVLAYATYLGRGSQSGIHTQPWYYYLHILTAYWPARGFFWTEGLIVGLAAVGAAFSLARRATIAGHEQSSEAKRHSTGDVAATTLSLVRFLAFYTLVLTVLYSALSYKTPWCMLSFLHGMILLAGFGARTLLCRAPWLPLKVVIGLLLAAGAVHLGWESRVLNFRLYADQQRNPYVYAHTSSDTLNLAAQMERLARASPEGRDMVIHVVTPENFWPLPWYLRQFNPNHIGYWQEPQTWARDTRQHPPPAVIILTEESQAVVDAHLRDAYNQQMIYGLRPGVLLSVYVREDLWKAIVTAPGR